MRKLRIYIIVLVILFLGGMFFWRYKGKMIKPVSLPPAQTYQAATVNSGAQNTTAAVVDPVVAGEINLNIPFTSQAPHQNWDLPYQEFCEEASTLMAASYVKGEMISGPDDADAKMLAIKDFEEKRLGTYKDTTAEETAVILKEYFSLPEVEVVSNPTEQSLKQALSQGKAAVIPAAGRELGNPNYKRPGPLYHMLVLKGYTKNGDFITNDPGTRNGSGYIYKPSVILNAIHDWNNGDVYTGKKVAIIVG